jgi:hypothetical protein
MTDVNQESISGIDKAPADIQLAVDLIQLLEENNIELETVISALEITLVDFKKKRLQQT